MDFEGLELAPQMLIKQSAPFGCNLMVIRSFSRAVLFISRIVDAALERLREGDIAHGATINPASETQRNERKKRRDSGVGRLVNVWHENEFCSFNYDEKRPLYSRRRAQALKWCFGLEKCNKGAEKYTNIQSTPVALNCIAF